MKIPRKIAEFVCEILNEFENDKNKQNYYADKWNEIIDNLEKEGNHIPRID